MKKFYCPLACRAAVCAMGGLLFLSCKGTAGFSDREKQIILESAVPMYVTVLPEDAGILRNPSREIEPALISDGLLDSLVVKMLLTVKSKRQDGVGIAAPQVGVNRRMAAVQRFDKEGEPFEVYVNLRIDKYLGEPSAGYEGCLSVPPMRGSVKRYPAVTVSYSAVYVDIQDEGYCKFPGLDGKRFSETVEGYTAVIFQHECDHLDGKLYIDKADSVFVSESWADARKAFNYDRPLWW